MLVCRSVFEVLNRLTKTFGGRPGNYCVKPIRPPTLPAGSRHASLCNKTARDEFAEQFAKIPACEIEIFLQLVEALITVDDRI